VSADTRAPTLAEVQRWCDRNRAALATHEAGHAAMALIVGSRLNYVTIVPRRVRGGFHCGHASVRPFSHAQDILGAVAGAVAESIRFKRKINLEDEDLACASQHVTPVGVRMFCRSAAGLLRMHWPGVVAIAAGLEGRGRLDGEEARDVFMCALCPPPAREDGEG